MSDIQFQVESRFSERVGACVEQGLRGKDWRGHLFGGIEYVGHSLIKSDQPVVIVLQVNGSGSVYAICCIVEVEEWPILSFGRIPNNDDSVTATSEESFFVLAKVDIRRRVFSAIHGPDRLTGGHVPNDDARGLVFVVNRYR